MPPSYSPFSRSGGHLFGASLAAALAVAGVTAAALPARASSTPVAPHSAPGAQQSATGMMPSSSPDYVPAARQTQTAAAARQTQTAAAASTSPTGIDVASYQHPNGQSINWTSVRSSGRSFAVIKATEGTGQNLYVNQYYVQDVRAASAAGLSTGAYHFARPEQSPTGQADSFASVMAAAPPTNLPPVLDLETTGGLSSAALVSWTHSFLAELQRRSGQLPMIYSSPGFWSSAMGGDAGFTNYPLWEAHWTSASAPAPMGNWATWSLWQYSDNDVVPGVSGAVDGDRSQGIRTGAAAPAGPPPAPAVSDNLIGVALNGTGSGQVEVHGVSASSGFHTYFLHKATALAPVDAADWRFWTGGFRGDRQPDLYAARLRGGASGRVEVHVFSAASGYHARVLAVATAMNALPAGQEVDATFAPYTGDGQPDLYVILKSATACGAVEVHAWSAASSYHASLAARCTAIPQDQVDPGGWQFTVDPTGSSGDLVGIKQRATGSGMVEVHTLTAASQYHTYSQHIASGIPVVTTGIVQWLARDWNGDGVTDLVGVYRVGAASGHTEVHVLSGAGGFTSPLLAVATPFGPTPLASWQFSFA